MTFGLLQPNARAAVELDVLVPPEHISTPVDHLYLVGRTSAPFVEISLNNELVQTVAAKDSIFHALLWFGYGLNEIILTAAGGGCASTGLTADTLTVLSAPQVTDEYERLFTQYTFHNQTPWVECTGCHAWGEVSQDEITEAAQCFECHPVIRERFRTHIPDNDRACINCHRLKQDLTRASTGTYAAVNPCYECHKDKIGEFTRDYIHGPVAGGSCTICHDPHGSIYDNSLVSPVPVLCPSCHGMEESKDMDVQHRPFAIGRCDECHDPHSTNNKWVLVKQSQELCLNCHLSFGTLKSHDHPYNVTPKRHLESDLKLTANGQLECLSCHDSHASNTKHLLRTDKANTCQGCHPDR